MREVDFDYPRAVADRLATGAVRDRPDSLASVETRAGRIHRGDREILRRLGRVDGRHHLDRSCLCLRSSVSSPYELLKAHDLTPTQYNALRILRGARDEGRSCSEIAERMINRDPDITRLVDRLERRGLVARSREGRDRRVITTRITTAGLKLLESLDGPVEDFNRRLLGPLGEQPLRTLIHLLDAVRERSE